MACPRLVPAGPAAGPGAPAGQAPGDLRRRRASRWAEVAGAPRVKLPLGSPSRPLLSRRLGSGVSALGGGQALPSGLSARTSPGATRPRWPTEERFPGRPRPGPAATLPWSQREQRPRWGASPHEFTPNPNSLRRKHSKPEGKCGAMASPRTGRELGWPTGTPDSVPEDTGEEINVTF